MNRTEQGGMQTPQTPQAGAPDGPAGGSRARAPRWMRAALIVSVTLNLLVAGVIVGGLIAHDRRPPHPVVGDVSLGPFTDALSKEDRAALRRAAQAEGRNFREMRERGSAELREVIAVLEQEPFDRARVEAMLGAMRARANARFDIGERLMIERLAEMGPEARRAFAERLRERLERFEHGSSSHRRKD